MNQELFDVGTPVPPRPGEGAAPGKPRLERPNRKQALLRPVLLEDLVDASHRVRGVWAFVESMDLNKLCASIRSREGVAGRAAIDPKLLVALWLYATLEGEGSARKLARLCVEHNAYFWLCGGVTVCAHTLSDFRTGHEEVLDDLLTQSVVACRQAGLIELKRVAQDGMRVRASAGADTFRREATLQQMLEEAQLRVQRLKKELEAEEPRPKAKAELSSATDLESRVAEALKQMAALQEAKTPSERVGVRVSTTDPEARVMKMGDGGFRPAYNIELATDTGSHVIVGVAVTNIGSDMGQMGPMLEQVKRRYGQAPDEWLVDGGFAKKEDIEGVSAPGQTKVYAPVQKPKQSARDPHQPRPDDAPAVAEWRARMGTPEAKEIYKERGATAECANAQARNRGMQQLKVRGLPKALMIALWFAVAHNVLRSITLGVLAAAGP